MSTIITPEMIAAWGNGSAGKVEPIPDYDRPFSQDDRAVLKGVRESLCFAPDRIKSTEQYMAEADEYLAKMDTPDAANSLFFDQGYFYAAEGDASDLVEKIKKLIEMNDQIKKSKDDLKELEATFDTEEALIFAAMESANVQSLKVDGKNVYRTVRVWASLPVETREAAIEWLQANGYEHLPKLTVNSQTLSAEMKIRIEEQGQASIPDFIKITPQNKLGIRK